MIRTSLTMLALGAAFACAENVGPTAPRVVTPPAVSFAKDKRGKTVAECKLQKEAWKTEHIGSRGGRVTIGKNTLVVPAGALTKTVAITAHALPTTSASVQFFPEGLQFALSARLTLDYSNCATPFVGVSIAYVQADTVTEVVPSNDRPILRSVTGLIRHFSSYAVAY